MTNKTTRIAAMALALMTTTVFAQEATAQSTKNNAKSKTTTSVVTNESGTTKTTTTTVTTTTSGDTTVTSTVNSTTLNLSVDDLAKLLETAANSVLNNSEQIKSSLSAAKDTTVAKGSEALRQIIKVDAATAKEIMSAIGIVADSVATASKGAIAAGSAATKTIADDLSKKITEGAKAMQEEAEKMSQAQADSLKNALGAARNAIDAWISDLDKKTSTKTTK